MSTITCDWGRPIKKAYRDAVNVQATGVKPREIKARLKTNKINMRGLDIKRTYEIELNGVPLVFAPHRGVMHDCKLTRQQWNDVGLAGAVKFSIVQPEAAPSEAESDELPPVRVSIEWADDVTHRGIFDYRVYKAVSYTGLPEGLTIEAANIDDVDGGGSQIYMSAPSWDFLNKDMQMQVNGVWLTVRTLSYGIGNPTPTGGDIVWLPLLPDEIEDVMDVPVVGTGPAPAWSKVRAKKTGDRAKYAAAQKIRWLRPAVSSGWGQLRLFESRDPNRALGGGMTYTYGEYAAQLRASLEARIQDIKDAEAVVAG